MSCPTCDHTMSNFGNGSRVMWCPRCGTIKYDGMDGMLAEEPKLVQRCIDFAGKITDQPFSGEHVLDEHNLFERLGILESILPPDLRNVP